MARFFSTDFSIVRPEAVSCAAGVKGEPIHDSSPIP
jgi:hypothetical protein